MMLLSDIGHEVQLVLNPLQAPEIAASFRPQVAILDIGLPGISGYELVMLLRRLKETAGCRFFSVSAYAGSEVARRSFQAGFEYHFAKPIVVPELLARLATASAEQLHAEPQVVPSVMGPALQRS